MTQIQNFILQPSYEVSIFPPRESQNVENQTENEADDLEFLSMDQKGKHWLRECEK